MYGKAKVGRPDWYMMGACIVFALTFSLRSVPLAVLLLLFMPFSLLSLTGELPLPTRNAPICQTLLCISIPLLVIGAFSSLLLLLPKLLIPSACVWLFGGALMLFLPPGAFRKSRMAMYWAVICFVAVVALLIMLLQRYQAYGDLYEGLSYDILRVMMNARTRPQVLYSAYVSGLAALDAKRTAALESLAALTGGNVLPWLSEDVLQQLEWSLRATIERTLPSIMPDLLVKGIMAFSLGMLLCWRKFPDAEDMPSADRWFMPTPLGISMAVLLLLSAGAAVYNERDSCAGGFAAGQCGVLELCGAGRFGAEFRHDTRGCNARPPLVPKHPDGAVRADSADVRGLRRPNPRPARTARRPPSKRR